ncbi:hypothetical protein DDE82_009028 [Stemphylium lycopersici]|uniref:HNH nuclease domain-containing protein n=1 Tax=Stemphylium lycopersici TaxID=183478 RepID=A0A364MRC3_STELY|nr:hypothetical protein TW65_06397 [Stemphylium lycopersici]RAQ98669.1 hypothetical protein DDE82_009028 [Stemphylium lycopersici]RAR00390.1 hypothetical protein DDE83_009112 [Stemphylium lycopersici]
MLLAQWRRTIGERSVSKAKSTSICYLANAIDLLTVFSAINTHFLTTLPVVQLRAPTQPPSPLQHWQLQILLRHPGYDDGSNVLFKLQASDTDDHGQPGLLIQFAIDACAIIAGDFASGRGWLSLSRDGSASIDPTSTLRERSYYFHLDAADDPYPIVLNFRQWKYPHERLPYWQQLAPDRNLASSSVAQVVPQWELDWWKANGMSRYNTGSTASLDDMANALLLPTDLQIAFDKPRIALVPKPATDGSMRLVAHLLENSPELEHLYHNRELHPTAVGVDMLYARFAWSVFTYSTSSAAGTNMAQT